MTGDAFAWLGASLRNGLEVAWLGGLGPAAESSPYEVVAERPVYRLRRYFPFDDENRPPVILVPPLMLSAEVWDVSPDTSAVAALHARGVAPWIVDFGSPERERDGVRRTLTDHVLAVSDAVDFVREASGRDVHLAGYSQGGMFCYQAAAYRRSESVASVVAFGSPVDLRKALPRGPIGDTMADLLNTLGPAVAPLLSQLFLPAWLVRRGFQMLDPIKEIQSQFDFVRNLYDRDRLMKREAQRRFLAHDAWVAYPGPALGDMVEQIVAQNRMLAGGLVIGDRSVTLADITCPVLAFVGTTDDIAPPGTVRAIRKAAPRAEVFERTMRAGHFGLVVGSKASQITWPTVGDWIAWREGAPTPPAEVHPIEEHASRPPEVDADTLEDFRDSAGLAIRFGREFAAGLGSAVFERVRSLSQLAETALPQLSRLVRLAQVRRSTRISPALVLAEQAKSHPDRSFFLFEDRAHSFADADRRVDAIVRGLISVGVRVGQRVGVAMGVRPSTIAVMTAISRLGGTSVMLRQGGPTAAELALGEVDHVVADPETAPAVREAWGRDVLVLGGGGGPRSLGPGLIDLEQVDPGRVELPLWYEANPGCAGEIALVFFSGDEGNLRARQITNARWALAAFGAASTAALTHRDTVYCGTPLDHPTGLMVCVGGALASGVRLAVARRFDAETFWEEVRRYGATVVFYKGHMLRDLVDAAPSPAEKHHPVRLFAGSGMPRNVWRRVIDRFSPVAVLELYTATEARVALANLSGEKIGCFGRPFPGTAEVVVACALPDGSALALDARGLARVCEVGESGLLLARLDGTRDPGMGRPWRSVFEAGDAWVPTGDLFRCDADGDHWLVDHVVDMIHTADGPIPSLPIADALGQVDEVSLAVAYGVRVEGASHDVPVAAVALRPGRSLDPSTLAAALEQVDPKPVAVRVVDEIPTTPGYRPRKQPLRAEGLNPSEVEGPIFVAAPDGSTWYPLDAAGDEGLSAG